ncbi:hypothetical protein CC78DRAFT_612620 [Lojkania enalia]|uniref:Uncharacterized protein n=1 Tax=Lojkania enalia TaxID=147567 RepID=A0A9P4TNM7_9PLEO|nr:hypothetical protein CC78DRAFT_612620 [Didymosphaeria enalia]
MADGAGWAWTAHADGDGIFRDSRANQQPARIVLRIGATKACSCSEPEPAAPRQVHPPGDPKRARPLSFWAAPCLIGSLIHQNNLPGALERGSNLEYRVLSAIWIGIDNASAGPAHINVMGAWVPHAAGRNQNATVGLRVESAEIKRTVRLEDPLISVPP